MNDGHFEAVKASWRQTKDGFYVTFCIHPNDIHEAIAMAPLGTRFMVAFAEIGDNEEVIKTPPVDNAAPKTIEWNEDAFRPGGEGLPEAYTRRPKRAFKDLPEGAQAGIRCADEEFQTFVLVVKGLRPTPGYVQDDEERTASAVRNELGVSSRSELSTSHAAADKWRKLNAEFEAWQLDQRYADVRR